MRGFHGYLGAALTSVSRSWSELGLAVSTWKRIKKDPRYKNHIPVGAVALNPMDDLRIAEMGRKTFKATVAHVILMINAWMGTRGRTPWKLCNKSISFESERKVFGVHRPRVSINMLTDKTHKEASKVGSSEAGSLMRSVECGCPDGKDHDKDSVMCEIPY